MGRYLDEETHLHENWNRYYDPVPGVYTSLEPLLSVAQRYLSVDEVNMSRVPLQQQSGPKCARRRIVITGIGTS